MHLYVVACIPELFYSFLWGSGVVLDPNKLIFILPYVVIVLLIVFRYFKTFPLILELYSSNGMNASDNGAVDCHGFLALWRRFCL